MKSKRKFCPNCEDYHQTFTEIRQQTYNVGKHKVTIDVECTVCKKCNETIGSDEEDQKVLDAIYDKVFYEEQGLNESDSRIPKPDGVRRPNK